MVNKVGTVAPQAFARDRERRATFEKVDDRLVLILLKSRSTRTLAEVPAAGDV